MLQSRLFLLVFLFFQATGLLAAQDPAVRNEISARVERIGTTAGLEIQGAAISSVIVIPALYQERDYSPLWTNQHPIRQLLDAIRSIGADGLDPTDYHLAALEQLQQQTGSKASPAQLADFDILLTDSLVRLGYHLMIGKVDPVALDQNWNMDKTVGDLDAVLAMANAVTNGSVDQLIDSLRPQAPIYAQMKTALARYQRMAAAGGWQSLAEGPAIKSDMSDPRVPALRERLAASGEFTGADRQSSIYDESLEQAVRLFQRRHGLEDDGIIGKDTLQALNVPVEQRIDQLRVNLERARWILNTGVSIRDYLHGHESNLDGTAHHPAQGCAAGDQAGPGISAEKEHAGAGQAGEHHRPGERRLVALSGGRVSLPDSPGPRTRQCTRPH
jgi:murein L,D-transpeptidase YcbB/YkuD